MLEPLPSDEWPHNLLCCAPFSSRPQPHGPPEAAPFSWPHGASGLLTTGCPNSAHSFI